jgi:type IV pilus assembly protein PilY1
VSDRTRIEIAQDVITDIVDANPAIDFGLAVFNRNYNLSGSYTASSNYDGARIVRRIIENGSASQRSNLVSLVDSLQPEGSTPLCESVYEAYRYIVGASVLYGNETYASDPPAKDAAAESAGKYLSPLSACQYVYVIVMTDGEPQLDLDANARIKTLTGKTCKKYKAAGIGSYPDEDENCLPELTEYMYNHDLDGDADNGEQKAITYTIGFHSDQKLLSDAATKGGGVYYTTNSAEGLADAFQGAVTGILSTSSTFTAPSVAVDTFTRTESRNEVFFAMFEPRAGTDWPGNIKKLRIDIDDGVATLVDADGLAALDDSGNIADTARTYWSSGDDGSTVDKGGVGQLLAERDPDSRAIKTNTGTGGALQDFVPESITETAFGVASETELLDLFGRGHSHRARQPARVGARLERQLEERDPRLDPGRHAAQPSAGAELRRARLAIRPPTRISVSWSAPTPASCTCSTTPTARKLGVLPEGARRGPRPAARQCITGRRPRLRRGCVPPCSTARTSTATARSTPPPATSSTSTSACAVAARPITRWTCPTRTARRSCGRSTRNTAGFGELGQSWSVPVMTYVPGYASDGVPKPVLVFGAGYDTAKDSKACGRPPRRGPRRLHRGCRKRRAGVGRHAGGQCAEEPATRQGCKHSIPAGVTVRRQQRR